MALGPRLEARQTQQLVLTPELRQAIQILQFTSVELNQYIAAEIQANPFLEAHSSETEVKAAPDEAGPRKVLDEVLRGTDPSNAHQAFDNGIDNLNTSAPRSEQSLPNGLAADEFSKLVDNLPGTPTMRDVLCEQIHLIDCSKAACDMALFLVDELDSDGYLRTALDELAQRLGASAEQVEDGIAVLQQCEPTGVGARNLGECFALQLAEKGKLDPDTAYILENISCLGAGSRPLDLARKCGVTTAKVETVLEQIRGLNPAPGAAYEVGNSGYAIPDVTVFRDNLGGWSVELTDEALPRLIVNNTYAAEVNSGDKGAVRYVTDCIARAGWLVRALDRRAHTILKVATEITRVQEAFFSHGIAHLRPMTTQAVAEKIGVNDSTVSRVTRGKYLSCERGTFEMKFFFTQAVRSAEGEADLSALAVREDIRRMIRDEDPGKPLSDDKIAMLLKDRGANIARRTVTKYREAMNIGSSVERRRSKRSGGAI